MSFKKNNTGTAMHTVSSNRKEHHALNEDKIEKLLGECKQFASSEEKLELLKLHDFCLTTPWVQLYLKGKAYCVHCGQIINPQDFKFWNDLIRCPHFPHCDGKMIDWMTPELQE